ncbi:hypothetical protein AB1Y20_002461 [Prymnesium parvum]|uniref:Aminotransferase class V domain-containing protein n=1 Tax=Prymnesium parvum TaxID=97485 RepID=A0AB34J9E3_PRYPA
MLSLLARSLPSPHASLLPFLGTSSRLHPATCLGTRAWPSERWRGSYCSAVGTPLPRAPEHGECIYLPRLPGDDPDLAGAATPSAARVRMRCERRGRTDNHAIMARRRAEGAASSPLPHVVTSTVEHPAVVECLRFLAAAGRLDVSWVRVDGTGRVCAREVAAAVTPHTILVTIMHSNNEVGAVQPVAEIVRRVRTHSARPSALVHTDAAQSAGKLPLDVRELGVDMLTLVGHKLGAPKGVAALYVRRPLRLGSLLHGGAQEGGRRAGTEAVLLLVALGEAARIAREELALASAHMARTRERLAALLVGGLGAATVRVHGPAEASHRLPNTLSIGIKGVRAAELLATLEDRVAASAGAACHSDDPPSVSPVLAAMGVPEEYAIGTLRLSTGRHTTMEEVEKAAALIIAEVKRQRRT